jgi:hypothetical protein
MNQLRSLYLDPKIAPAPANLNVAVLLGGYVFGALGFSPEKWGKNGIYMMSDFAISGSPYRRLAKLVLGVAQTVEVKCLVEQAIGHRVEQVCTTVFTDKPVSSKYRGSGFELESRKPGRLNYAAKAGRWNLADALEWWHRKEMEAKERYERETL